jgi:hypothetical protein
MLPLRTARLTVALGALLIAGCGGTTNYAVLSSQSPSDGGRCFDDCARVHSATKRYLECMRRCPGARVVEDEQCGTISFDGNRFACTTEQILTFSVLEIVAGILVGVAAFGALYVKAVYAS